ncbi:MAG: LamG-like jellyroll fold domain-containing protein [Candidatus Methylacidiphilales bacterium]|nr:LamG-like jellyroll fold domain-containing protein [Candidatus Methylacidiphilales bacterium]
MSTPAPSVSASGLDPLLEASAYRDKQVWSYHSKDPLPWTQFKPRDYGSSRVKFSSEGVRPVGRVPAPGVHPRIFFSPEDLPALRKRLKEDRAGQEAWKNILAWSHALKLTYDEKADYAQPDWANGGFHVRGRFVDLHRIGGYNPKREDYYSILASGGRPQTYEKNSPALFFKPGAAEAFRCLIEEDKAAAEVLAKATITAIKLEQERRAANDKPVKEGEPPKPSTGRTDACALGFIYDFIYNYLTPEQKKIIHEELVLLSAWADNYGSFNNAEASRSNWATFSYWVYDLMAIEGEPGFNDLKYLALYRGWRNFYTYSFFDSGAAYEGEGKLLFGLDAAVVMDRVAHKYRLEPLTQHPLVRAYYGKFSAYAMLPTRDNFAVFDILGSIKGGFTTPHDLVVARYLYPNDKTTDFVYRAMVQDDYKELPHGLHSLAHQAITSAIFATAYTPEVQPEKLNIGNTFFCGQRALLMTRSSWDREATFLTMHTRGASGGHPYPDRNGIMLTGKGRPWITIPSKDQGPWACSTVIIDEAGQDTSTPARVVDFADQPLATFMTGDAKYCWDWVWSSASKTTDGRDIRREDVEKDMVERGMSWELVNQSFNDFAWTQVDQPVYRQPLKFRNSWIAPDGVLTPYLRQVNTPVLRSFRTAGLVRGPRPYVLVIDDVERDGLPARYDWNLTLMPDVVEARGGTGELQPGDIVLAGNASLDPSGALKTGEPGLLIRVLNAEGTRAPHRIELREKVNLLTLSTRAAAPGFKVLLHPFRGGEALPQTEWNADRASLQVSFVDQKDVLTFAPSPEGRTVLGIQRDGKMVLDMKKTVPALEDPGSTAITEELRRIPALLEVLKKEGYDPLRLPGFIAGWEFDRAVDGAFSPLPGSVAAAIPIPLGERTFTAGMNGRQAVVVGPEGIGGPLGFATEMKGQPFTVSCWLKTRSGPFMGSYLNVDGVIGSEFIQGTMRHQFLRTLKDGWPSSMLSSWTHVVFSSDGSTLSSYRNGRRMAAVPLDSAARWSWGKTFVLGGKSQYGDAEVAAQSVHFYNTAMDAAAVERLYVWQKFSTVPVAH